MILPARSSIPVVCCVPSTQVRGQCPKVAKQDKKKKPKGRAGKRITVSDGVFEEEARAKKQMNMPETGGIRLLLPLFYFFRVDPSSRFVRFRVADDLTVPPSSVLLLSFTVQPPFR